MRLRGKTALVTGAGRGIGQAIALAFAREGADVAVHYGRSAERARQVVHEIEGLGRKALLVQADFARAQDIAALYERLEEAFPHLDIVVNNAAIFNSDPLLDISEETWDQLIATNLKSVFLSCQHAARRMREQGGGVIINFSSGVGLSARPGYDVSVAYAASKAGVIRMSQRMAIELAPSIRVNCLVPGMIDSKPEPMSEDVRQQFARLTPLARVGTAEDLAAASVFLASDEAAFITGQTIVVDGGLTMT